jgi:protein-tyrosine phosphatase
VICDFRGPRERDAEPTLWPGEPAPVIRARDREIAGGGHMRTALAGAAPDADTMRVAMQHFYAALPYDHLDSYAGMFAELLAGNLPLIFNCSAGKDRTGVAAALLLTALGVRHDEILRDYSISERVVDYEAVATRAGGSDTAVGFAAVSRLPPELRAPLLRSDPAYLDAALDAIARQEGSVAAYLAARLGVGAAETRALRHLLLEAA